MQRHGNVSSHRDALPRGAFLFFLFVAASFIFPAIVSAENAPTTRSMLDQMNRETTLLYRQVQPGIYHVQLPEPKWINAYAMAGMKRSDRQLEAALEHQLAQPGHAGSGSRPTDDATTIEGGGTFILVDSRNGAGNGGEPALGGKLSDPPATQPGFDPNYIGLLIDDAGHILVPWYVEREAVGAEPVKVAGADGVLKDAKFVGSDRQTNLTLLQVEGPAGHPVRLEADRPDAGSLVLCLSSRDGSGRLALWTDGSQENSIVLTTDARVAGVARHGQFLSGNACKLIARQLIEHGSVKRATLGVLITEIRGGDVHAPAGMAIQSAMRIDQVMAGSAADSAGLKVGDLVLSIAREPVADLPSFAAAIAARTGPTELAVLRDQQLIRVTVDLQQQK
jgi:hypothetical protein